MSFQLLLENLQGSSIPDGGGKIIPQLNKTTGLTVVARSIIIHKSILLGHVGHIHDQSKVFERKDS